MKAMTSIILAIGSLAIIMSGGVNADTASTQKARSSWSNYGITDWMTSLKLLNFNSSTGSAVALNKMTTSGDSTSVNAFTFAIGLAPTTRVLTASTITGTKQSASQVAPKKVLVSSKSASNVWTQNATLITTSSTSAKSCTTCTPVSAPKDVQKAVTSNAVACTGTGCQPTPSSQPKSQSTIIPPSSIIFSPIPVTNTTSASISMTKATFYLYAVGGGGAGGPTISWTNGGQNGTFIHGTAAAGGQAGMLIEAKYEISFPSAYPPSISGKIGHGVAGIPGKIPSDAHVKFDASGHIQGDPAGDLDIVSKGGDSTVILCDGQNATSCVTLIDAGGGQTGQNYFQSLAPMKYSGKSKVPYLYNLIVSYTQTMTSSGESVNLSIPTKECMQSGGKEIKSHRGYVCIETGVSQKFLDACTLSGGIVAHYDCLKRIVILNDIFIQPDGNGFYDPAPAAITTMSKHSIQGSTKIGSTTITLVQSFYGQGNGGDVWDSQYYSGSGGTVTSDIVSNSVVPITSVVPIRGSISGGEMHILLPSTIGMSLDVDGLCSSYLTDSFDCTPLTSIFLSRDTKGTGKTPKGTIPTDNGAALSVLQVDFHRYKYGKFPYWGFGGAGLFGTGGDGTVLGAPLKFGGGDNIGITADINGGECGGGGGGANAYGESINGQPGRATSGFGADGCVAIYFKYNDANGVLHTGGSLFENK